jgi:hypothetical protein
MEQEEGEFMDQVAGEDSEQSGNGTEGHKMEQAVGEDMWH